MVDHVKRFSTDDRGSLTLESAIVFPVFLGVLLLLINVINISLSYIAMDHAVSETVKQTAVHAYPLKYLNANRVSGDTQGEFDDYFNIISRTITGTTIDGVVNTLTKYAVLTKIKEVYHLSNIAVKDIRITEFKMYTPNNMGEVSGTNNERLSDEDIAVTVEYKIKLLLPFMPMQEIVMSNTAVERAWADD